MDEWIIAERSFSWRDEDKFCFLWGTEFVLVYYNQNNKLSRILTHHEPEIEETIYAWLKGITQKETFGFIEPEDQAEEEEKEEDKT